MMESLIKLVENVPHLNSAVHIAELLSGLDGWKYSFDNNENSISLEVSKKEKEISFLVTEDKIIWFKFDHQGHQPYMWSGFHPSDEDIVKLIDWVK